MSISKTIFIFYRREKWCVTVSVWVLAYRKTRRTDMAWHGQFVLAEPNRSQFAWFARSSPVDGLTRAAVLHTLATQSFGPYRQGYLVCRRHKEKKLSTCAPTTAASPNSVTNGGCNASRQRRLPVHRAAKEAGYRSDLPTASSTGGA